MRDLGWELLCQGANKIILVSSQVFPTQSPDPITPEDTNVKETGARPKLVQKINVRIDDEHPSPEKKDVDIPHEYEDIANPEERNVRESNVSDIDYIPEDPPHIPPRRTRGLYFSHI